MALMTITEKDLVAARLQRLWDRGEPVTITRPQFREVIDDIDAWREANLPSLNAALRLPHRTLMTPRQKARALIEILREAYDLGRI